MLNKKVILTLLFSIIIIVIIALVTNNKMDDENYKALFIRKVYTKQKYDVIIAGDSRIYRGVSARIVGNKLNLKTLNLGFSSGGHSTLLFNLIDKHLNMKSPDKTIILGITPASLTNRAGNNGHIKRILNRKKEEVIEYEYLFPVKLFFAPTTPYKIRKKLRKRKSNDYRQEFNIEDGWVASWYDTPIPYRALESYKDKFTKMKVENNIIKNLYKQTKKWKSQGIKVYGFYIPSSKNMNELEKNVAAFDIKKFLKGFINAGGYWINIESNYFSYDGSHLEKESAIRLSEELAEKISQNNIIKIYNPEIKINDIYDIKNYIYLNTLDSSLNLFNNKESVPYSKTFYKEALSEAKSKKITNISIEAKILYPNSDANAILGCKVKNYKAEINTNYSTVSGKPCKLFLDFKLPENYQNSDTLKIYIKNIKNYKLYLESLNIYYIYKADK